MTDKWKISEKPWPVQILFGIGKILERVVLPPMLSASPIFLSENITFYNYLVGIGIAFLLMRGSFFDD